MPEFGDEIFEGDEVDLLAPFDAEQPLRRRRESPSPRTSAGLPFPARTSCTGACSRSGSSGASRPAPSGDKEGQHRFEKSALRTAARWRTVSSYGRRMRIPLSGKLRLSGGNKYRGTLLIQPLHDAEDPLDLLFRGEVGLVLARRRDPACSRSGGFPPAP